VLGCAAGVPEPQGNVLYDWEQLARALVQRNASSVLNTYKVSKRLCGQTVIS
jgi:hypothetical protein